MHKTLQKIGSLFRKPKKVLPLSQLEKYLKRKQKLWDEGLKYIQELSLTKP